MDIAEFLNARLDEEEKEAHNISASRSSISGVLDSSRDTWFNFPGGHEVYNGVPGDYGDRPMAVGYDHNVAGYIASHDPARVLAEVTAKRRILEVVLPSLQTAESELEYESGGGDRHSDGSDLLLRLLAAPYTDHPDFDPAWRVE